MKYTPEQLDRLESYKQAETQISELQGIAKKLQTVINELNNVQHKGEKNTGDMGSLLMDIRESIDELVSKEDPEQPDYAKPVVEAVNKLEKALSSSISKIDVKPEVKVDAPETPKIDLKGVEKVLKTDIPKAFDKSIKSIPQTELPETDFSPLVDKLEELAEKLNSIDTGVRLKPQSPTTMKVTNPDGSPIGGSSNYAVAVDNYTTTNVIYVGKAAIGSVSTDPVWQIKKVDAATGAIISWCDGNDNFDNVWGATFTSGDAASLTYS